MVILENEYLKIEINTLGAEISKIYSKKTNLNYLWNGDASFWKRHAPILFPIVGKLKENTYKIDDEKYQLPQHGFARDTSFTVLTKNDTKVTFQLLYSTKTIAKYPYKFSLQICYELKDSQLSVSYKVVNLDNQTIYFSIGAHPAFNCPLIENTSFNDYFIEFEKEETPTQLFLNPKTGFRNNASKKVNLGQKIDLSYDLFTSFDTLIYKGITSKTVSLKSKKHAHGIHLHFPDWKYLAFWTKETGTPFICIEPWMGISDSDDSNQILKDKTGMLNLAETKTYENSYSFDFF
ncbi:aldose 1-epimerase family protein [Tenacibaculum insulae]|uniref:aldose 1-epimerase family protein n=1 Tax=Tenacibaculum insulae TaxID=2029677 RepID=UPI003AB10F7F